MWTSCWLGWVTGVCRRTLESAFWWKETKITFYNKFTLSCSSISIRVEACSTRCYLVCFIIEYNLYCTSDLKHLSNILNVLTYRKDSTLRCGNDKHSHLLRKCFNGKDWSNVSLEEFLDCDQNLGFNRQTRMLADLSLVGCYSNIFNLTEKNLDRCRNLL